MKKGLWLTLIVMACLVACKRGRTTADATVGDTLRLKYAEKLTIVKHDGFTEVMLADPWNKWLPRACIADCSCS